MKIMNGVTLAGACIKTIEVRNESGICPLGKAAMAGAVQTIEVRNESGICLLGSSSESDDPIRSLIDELT
jgi:hypothetical protein